MSSEFIENVPISDSPCPKDNAEVVLNEYSYLETGGFSSERFKIEIKNLPKFYGISELKKLFIKKLQLKPGKIKPPRRGSSWLYVCFHSEEDRKKAIETLEGYNWKGKTLQAHMAQPAPDPLFRKRRLEADNEEGAKKAKVDDKTQEEKIKDSTTPFWNIPYEQQLENKQKAIYQIILKTGNELWKIHHSLRNYIETMRKVNNGLMCSFEPIKSAPLINGYRNKCEFTVGLDEETKLPTVGFRIGSYVTGFTGVAPVDSLCHISDAMKKAVVLFQDFVRSSGLKVYSPEDHSGNWSGLMIRQSFTSGALMLVIGVNPQDLSEDKLSELKRGLVDHFTSEASKDYSIKSLYFQCIVKKKSGERLPNAEHLWGDTHIYETIHGINFRVSPEAFFQINTAGAEILYQTAIDLAEPSKNSTVVDICCGTGSIGLCFSKHCDQVLGLELVPEAITDAKFNAATNNISNSDFFVGRAEDILSSVVSRATNQDVIAIIDPPRAGLHMKAITQLRHMKQIKKLVFVSCDPSAAVKNFVDLGRASSKTMRGNPFIITKAVAVDMFPHTKHTELVLLLERMDEEVYKSYKNNVTPTKKSEDTGDNSTSILTEPTCTEEQETKDDNGTTNITITESTDGGEEEN